MTSLLAVYRSVIDRLAALGYLPLKDWTPEEKDDHWKAADRTARKHEPAYRQAARDVFNEQMRAVLALVSEAQKAALSRKASIDWQQLERDVQGYLDEAGDLWRQAFIPVVEGLVTDQGKYWAAKLGFQFNVQNLYARDFFNRYTLTFSNQVNTTTKEGLGKLLAQGQAEGWSIPRTQRNIEQVFKQWMFGDGTSEDFEWYKERLPPYRTETIARSETMRSSNAGTTELYKEWGVQRREWIATRDDRVRDTHLAADGQIVAINQPFTLGDYQPMYPGDPILPASESVNCRCATAAVVEDEIIGEPSEQMLSFETRDDADRYGATTSGINPQLTDSELEAITDYKYRTYKYINPYLREGISEDDWAPEIASIDSALQKTFLRDNLTAYRGMDANAFPKSNQSGGIFEDKGFWSTTLSKETGDKYARWAAEDGASGLVIIDIPKGSKGIWMEKFWETSGESELLLPRGTRAEIISDTMQGEVRVMTVKVLP